MAPDKKRKPRDDRRREPLPSTGEGADSALDVLKKKRRQVPTEDPTSPLTPPKKP